MKNHPKNQKNLLIRKSPAYQKKNRTIIIDDEKDDNLTEISAIEIEERKVSLEERKLKLKQYEIDLKYKELQIKKMEMEIIISDICLDLFFSMYRITNSFLLRFIL